MIFLKKVGLLKPKNWTKEQVAVHAAKVYAVSCTPVTIASSAGLCAGVSSFSPVQFHSSDNNTVGRNYVVGENIGEFSELTAIRQCFAYQYFPYPNIFNRCLLLQLHT